MDIIGGAKNFVGGLLSGGKARDIFFPKISLLSDYGIGNGQVFSVAIKAFKQADVNVAADESGDGITVQTKQDPSPIAEYEIIYSPKSINLTHSHDYGRSSFIHKTVDDITNKKVAGLNIGNAVAIANGVKQLSEGNATPIKTPWNTFGGIDLAQAYTGSTPPTFPLEFSLVTHNDPLVDVVFPATLLAYMSYPKTSSNNKGVSSILDAIGGGAKSLLGALGGGGGSESEKTAGDATEVNKNKLNKLAEGAKELTKGKWRYLVGDAPPYWTLSCSNGIYSMFNASLKSVDITYHGPWIESPSAGQGGVGAVGSAEALQIAVAAGGGFSPSKIFGGTGGGLSADAFTSSLGQNNFKGYPSYADVRLVFENNYSKVFGEEIIAGLTGSSVSVNVS